MHIIIIGAGPGGYETAVEASKKGIEVTLVSEGPVGGTCLNEGCIPTKTLWKSASLLEEMRRAAEFGISAGTPGISDGTPGTDAEDAAVAPSIDLEKAMERKEAVTAQLRAGIEFLLKNKLIRLVRGHASFKAAEKGVCVTVCEAEGECEEICADKAIIASGSTPATLPVEGKDLPGVLNSSELLDIREIPRRLCIIGAGVIGLEFASIFRSFGSEVAVVEYCRDILPRFDTDLAKRLKQQLGKKGISIETSAAVQSIVAGEDGSLKVNYLKKDKECSIEADKVLMAVGRRPRVDSLNLEAVGVEYGPKGIVTDGCMRTSNPDIYAIGDVRGKMMLAHVASFEGKRALNSILGEDADDGIDFGIIPAAVFTLPEAATVGLSEDECKLAGRAVRCSKSQYRSNGKALSLGESEGWCKIVSDAESGEILGCHLFGAHASDLVHEIAALMKCHAGLGELHSLIHAHPTLAEVLMAAE